MAWAGLALPWLYPFASGPSSSVDPWLFSGLCVAIAYAVLRPAALRRGVILALAGVAAWAVIRTGPTPEIVALAAASLLMFMAAGLAAAGWRRPEIVRAVVWAWVAAAVASTVIALCQYLGIADRFAPWMNASSVGEAFGNLRQRNQFATLTAIGMAALLWMAPAPGRRWVVMGAMALLAVGNAATTSRTGLAQIFALGLLVGAWPGPRRDRALLWLLASVVYVVAALALPWLLEVVTGNAGNRLWERVSAVDACSSRAVLWSNVLHLIAQKPWLGWGWGELDYAHYATLYPGPRFCDILDNAHDLPLHLAVELGLPAAAVLCGGLLWAVLRARPWREADPVRQMAWAVLAVIAMHSLLEYPLWYGPFQIAFGLCLGLLWPAAPSPRAAPSGAANVVLAACVVAACAYAAWDYRRVSQIYLPPEARAAGYRDDPLPRARQSWLFRNQAAFADLTVIALTRDNALAQHELAGRLLHYSPEPRVIEKWLESAVILRRDDDMDLVLQLARFRAAFPADYEVWKASHRSASAPAR